MQWVGPNDEAIYLLRRELQALKALSLVRLDREDEAYALCTEVKDANTTDEHILQTVTMVYQALDKRESTLQADLKVAEVIDVPFLKMIISFHYTKTLLKQLPGTRS